METKRYALDNSLGYLAGRFFRLILKRNVEQFHKNGITLTPDQWIALVHLWTQDGIYQQILANMMHQDRATTTRLLKSLETKDLLYRIPSQTDGREKIVYLTDLGRSTMKQATELVSNVLDKSYAGIDREKLDVCREVLNQLYANLD